MGTLVVIFKDSASSSSIWGNNFVLADTWRVRGCCLLQRPEPRLHPRCVRLHARCGGAPIDILGDDFLVMPSCLQPPRSGRPDRHLRGAWTATCCRLLHPSPRHGPVCGSRALLVASVQLGPPLYCRRHNIRQTIDRGILDAYCSLLSDLATLGCGVRAAVRVRGQKGPR